MNGQLLSDERKEWVRAFIDNEANCLDMLQAADSLASAADDVLHWYDAMPGTGHAEEVMRSTLSAYRAARSAA